MDARVDGGIDSSFGCRRRWMTAVRAVMRLCERLWDRYLRITADGSGRYLNNDPDAQLNLGEERAVAHW